MIEKDYIKELFQEKLTSHEVPVRADLWTSVSSSIGGSSVVASSMSIATKIIIAASVSAVALVTFYLVNDKNSVPIPIKKENPQEQRIITIDSLKIEEVKKDEKLPSINKVCLEFSISRDTVLQAYEELKKRGIIYSILGKGYYIKTIEVKIKKRIFLLFDELNIFKEDLYNSFLENIGMNTQVDIFFHHFNIQMFHKIINESNGNYTKYIIMPTNLDGAAAIIRTLPVEDVYIIDQTNTELKSFPAVYQNHKKDIYNGLKEGKTKLIKYEKIRDFNK